MLSQKIRIRVQIKSDNSQLKQKDKHKNLIYDQHRREEEYQQSLKEMYERLEKKLCLCEEIEVSNAKRRTQSQIDSILEKCNL